MHDTARCLGYPSDSMRAARERAPGDYLQSCRSSPTALVARPSPLWLIYRPVALLPIPWFICRPSGLALAPVAQLPSPLWLGSRPCGSTAVCLGSSLPCQIKPGPSYAAAVIGVQRGAGLSWRDGVCLLARRALYFTWAASGG